MLTSFALTRMVGAARSQPNVSNNAAWFAVSPEIGPQFPEHGAGNRAPISGKTSPPEIGAQFGPLVGGIEPATFRLQACAPPTRPNSGGQHGHTSSFATWPSPPVPTKSKIQNPNSKRPVWILDFGFWISDFGFWILDFGFRILDFGFWISDFGFWILDLFSLRSFCGGPKRPRLDFGFWISDFGFWILDFGFWILDFGFWILDYFPSFGSCIRYFLITPTRVGGLYTISLNGRCGSQAHIFLHACSMFFSWHVSWQSCHAFHQEAIHQCAIPTGSSIGRFDFPGPAANCPCIRRAPKRITFLKPTFGPRKPHGKM